MGGFCGSVQVRTTDRAAVLAAVETVSAGKKIHCLIGPEINGWVGVYPEGGGQDDSVGQEIAARFSGHAIHLLVHDDDLLAYWLWSDGKLIDRYHSAPGYFGEEKQLDEEPLVGNPNVFSFLLDDAARATLAKVLDRDARMTFESERLQRLGKLLGIKNAVSSYEYFKEEGGPRIKGRREFVEIPADESAAREKSGRASVAKQVRDERKRLKSAGLLLAHFDNAAMNAGPVAVAGGFIRFPTPHYYEQPSSLEFHSPPWVAPRVAGFDLPPRSNPFNVVASPSGQWVAAQADTAIRIWEWNGTAARHVVDVPTPQFASVFAISNDGKMIAETVQAGANSNHELVVHRIGSQLQSMKLSFRGLRQAAFSPDNRLLAVAAGTVDLISVADVLTRRSFSATDVAHGMPAATVEAQAALSRVTAVGLQALIAKKGASFEKEFASLEKMKIVGEHLTTEQIGQARQTMEASLSHLTKLLQNKQSGKLLAEQPRPTEQVFCVGFSRDGRWFWYGSSNGLRVFETFTLNEGATVLPSPVWSVAAPLPPDWKGGAHVYSTVEENTAPAVIFAGIASRVMRLDLLTGAVRSLLDVPGATGVMSVDLSQDDQYLAAGSTNNRAGLRKLESWFQVWDYRKLSTKRA